jgi:hypothetical protein
MTTAPTADAPAPETLRALLPRRTRRLLLGILMLSLAAYLASATGQFRSSDDENLFSTAHSLVFLEPGIGKCTNPVLSPDFLYTGGPHGCIDPADKQEQQSYQKGSGGKPVSKYGIGEPLAASPFFATGRIAAAVFSDKSVGSCSGLTAIRCCQSLTGNAGKFRANCQGSTRDMIVQTTTLFTNSFLTAFALLFVIIVSLQLGASLRGAALIGFAYGFGSYAFAYAKALGAEPGTAMCLIAAVMFAIEASRTRQRPALVACGVAAGAAVLFRSTAAIFLPVLGLWFLAVTFRKAGVRNAVRDAALFSLGAFASLLALAGFNEWRYGNALSLGYGQSSSNLKLKALRAGGSIFTGLWGQWLSPGKSILLYAPFVILAIAGVVISFRKLPAEMSLLVALVAANTLLFARVKFWAGDWAWGPRYMIIVLPCLAVMCAPLVRMVPWRRALTALAAVGVLFPGGLGVLVNFDVFYLQTQRKFGPGFVSKIWHDWSLQPIGHHVSVLAHEVGNFGHPYGLLYLTGKPRLDIWWLDDRWWITQHPGRLAFALLALAVIGALAIGGGLVMARARRIPAHESPRLRARAAV